MLYLWIAVNLIGIAVGSFISSHVLSNLLSELLLAQKEVNGFNLLSALTFYGAIQGFILSGLQAIVLQQFYLSKAVQGMVITIISMVVGMTLPTIYGLIMSSKLTSISNSFLIGLFLSWLLAGLFWGVFLGRTKQQKLGWGLINAGAYTLWGIAGVMVWLGMPLAIDYRESGLIELAIAIVTLGSGLALNGFVFRGLVKDQRHSRMG